MYRLPVIVIDQMVANADQIMLEILIRGTLEITQGPAIMADESFIKILYKIAGAVLGWKAVEVFIKGRGHQAVNEFIKTVKEFLPGGVISGNFHQPLQ